jgi:hypothetical protein
MLRNKESENLAISSFLNINDEVTFNPKSFKDLELSIEEFPDMIINGADARILLQLCSNVIRETEESAMNTLAEFVNLKLQLNLKEQVTNPTHLSSSILKAFLINQYPSASDKLIKTMVDEVFSEFEIPFIAQDSPEEFNMKTLEIAHQYLSTPKPAKYSDDRLVIFTPSKVIQFTPAEATELIWFYYENHNPRTIQGTRTSLRIPYTVSSGKFNREDIAYIISNRLFEKEAVHRNTWKILRFLP